ncbi:hypothetical protein AC578_3958 [Pseudocercospora eumusae]|uniref:Uncharacterized protein n=1 Tax=Pseudocercospora eumusae TaxID=321146 RepID=A0A139HLW8_9PEZI|nr:hypothetical protein AC578_3958 [Pseudocercospora eumusae]
MTDVTTIALPKETVPKKARPAPFDNNTIKDCRDLCTQNSESSNGNGVRQQADNQTGLEASRSQLYNEKFPSEDGRSIRGHCITNTSSKKLSATFIGTIRVMMASRICHVALDTESKDYRENRMKYAILGILHEPLSLAELLQDWPKYYDFPVDEAFVRRYLQDRYNFHIEHEDGQFFQTESGHRWYSRNHERYNLPSLDELGDIANILPPHRPGVDHKI